MTTNWSKTLTIPQFDSSLGTLPGATFICHDCHIQSHRFDGGELGEYSKEEPLDR